MSLLVETPKMRFACCTLSASPDSKPDVQSCFKPDGAAYYEQTSGLMQALRKAQSSKKTHCDNKLLARGLWVKGLFHEQKYSRLATYTSSTCVACCTVLIHVYVNSAWRSPESMLDRRKLLTAFHKSSHT